MNCLVGCIGEKIGNTPIKMAPTGSVYAPFVIATLTNGEKYITVGNKSSPTGSACIKSFNYGATDGYQCSIEIVDEEGGEFEAFFCKILNNPSKQNEQDTDQYTIKVQWGWIVASDDGTVTRKDTTSQEHWFFIHNINIKFEAKVKFTLECTDTFQSTFETRNDKEYGTEDKKMPLKEAIRQLCAENKPPIKDVKFKRKLASGTSDDGTEWDFDCKGCPGVWRCEGNHLLDIIWNWVKDFSTENKKGILLTTASNQKEPNLTLWESSVDKDFKNLDSIGAYIVGGGDCSPVISFNPDIRFSLSNISLAGGVISNKDGFMSTRIDEKNPEEVKKAGQGILNSNQISDNAKECYGTDAGEEVVKADKKNQEANSYISTYQPISAELKILGDPSLDDPYKMRYSKVSIIVINPFSITKVGSFDDWRVNGALAGSVCNEILSNPNWIIQGVAHDIKEGSYVTSLKVMLPDPEGRQFKC